MSKRLWLSGNVVHLRGVQCAHKRRAIQAESSDPFEVTCLSCIGTAKFRDAADQDPRLSLYRLMIDGEFAVTEHGRAHTHVAREVRFTQGHERARLYCGRWIAARRYSRMIAQSPCYVCLRIMRQNRVREEM